jgi:hypothetical protein
MHTNIYTCIYMYIYYIHLLHVHLCIICTCIICTPVHTSIVSTPVEARSMASCERVSTDMMAFPPCPAGKVPKTPPHVDSEMATCGWVVVGVGVGVGSKTD